MNVPCPYFSYTNEEVFQAVNAFELGLRAMVEIETLTGGIVYIVWFWAGWMFWRFLLNLKGQCTKHREFPPSLSPCRFSRHDKIMSAASRNWRNLRHVWEHNVLPTKFLQRFVKSVIPRVRSHSRVKLSVPLLECSDLEKLGKKEDPAWRIMAEYLSFENFNISVTNIMSNKYSGRLGTSFWY